MDRLERIDDKEAAMLVILRGWQAGIYTSSPAIIDSFDPSKQTCTAQLAIKARVDDSTAWAKVKQAGDVAPWVTLPKLVDIPVHFPSGGGYTLTFPVQPGDEALIVFSQRCIDNWFMSGGVQSQADFRMHDLSDGFAFVGVRSLARLLSGGVKTTAAQLRADDGSTYVEVAAGQLVNVKAPGGINLNGVVIDASGNVTAPAGSTIKAPTINGTTQVIFAGKNSTTHTHGGVQTGSGATGAPS